MKLGCTKMKKHYISIPQLALGPLPGVTLVFSLHWYLHQEIQF